MANQYDMGTSSIKRLMVQMAVPALVGQVVNLLYNIVDRIYIGHLPEIGGLALTGVGLFTPILMLITAFAMLAGAGGAPRAAIAMGQGNKEKAEQILSDGIDGSTDFFKELGVNNVHKRLQYQFGEQYGISIESELGKYTTMSIHIPMVTLDSDTVSDNN